MHCMHLTNIEDKTFLHPLSHIPLHSFMLLSPNICAYIHKAKEGMMGFGELAHYIYMSERFDKVQKGVLEFASVEN